MTESRNWKQDRAALLAWSAILIENFILTRDLTGFVEHYEQCCQATPDMVLSRDAEENNQAMIPDAGRLMSVADEVGE